jgi:predicted O-methyltransferase YrrM
MSEQSISAMLDEAYQAMEGSDISMEYSARHGIQSAAVLTVSDDETASLIAERLAPRIEGKTVIEIGGGIGLLALHMGFYARRVYCIEANPVWTSAFLAALFAAKLKNVSFLFGAADEFADCIRGDVALFCTHSGVDPMRKAAAAFAPVVIDVYGEMIAANPKAFDATASALRRFA